MTSAERRSVPCWARSEYAPAAAHYVMVDQSSNEATCRLLNELIVACLDEHSVHRAAADVTDSHDQRAHLRYSADRRADFAKELGVVVRAFGGSPAASGSGGEWFRATTLSLRGRVFGKNATAAADACARVDARVDELYERAMKAGLPDRARAAIVRQHAELVDDRATFRRLRASAIRA